jgi:hypothetical protein
MAGDTNIAGVSRTTPAGSMAGGVEFMMDGGLMTMINLNSSVVYMVR